MASPLAAPLDAARPARGVSPRTWASGLSAPPELSGDAGTELGALVRRWRDVEPDISQPALDHHYLTMHLGGAKQVTRRGEGATEIAEVEPGAMSIVPAGAAFEWSTRGPIEFAHLYLAPHAVERLGAEEFGRGAIASGLSDRVGMRDPLIQALFVALLDETANRSAGSRLYVDTLLRSLVLVLLRRYAGAPSTGLRLRHTLAPARLRRVLEFIEANLTVEIALADLAAVAATSPFHFSRAFRASTGSPPYAYLIGRRIEHAKSLLLNGPAPVAAIAGRCGFHSVSQFSRMFRRVTGRSPTQFRSDSYARPR